MTDLTNKVALITGSAKGIGKAIALRFARSGANIVINYAKDHASAEATLNEVKRFGVNAITVQADVSKVNDIRRLFDTAQSAFGRPDIVVVNAGVELVGVPVTDFTEAQYDQLFGINTKGAYFTMQQAAHRIADQWRIIYIGSSTTGYPRPGYALHGGSKVAPDYLVRVLAQELGKRGVTVNAVIPTATQGAGVNSTIEDRERIQRFIDEFMPMGRLATVGDVADACEYFAGPLSGFVSGQQLLLSGGGLT